MFKTFSELGVKRGLIILAGVGLLIAVVIIFLVLRVSASTSAVSSREMQDMTADAGLPKEVGGQSAELLSAFHGLDALPRLANVICRGSKGYGGMPVIFSTEIDLNTMQAGDFQVMRASGQPGSMHCVSLLPAVDPGELRTALLIGDLGPSDTDPPIRVDIVGHLHSIDGSLDFKGTSMEVTPLADGPSLIHAEIVRDWTLVGDLGPTRTQGSLCPTEGVVQAVRVTWAGGVTLANGDEPGEAERTLYRITVVAGDGTQRDVAPVALADLGDGDNNHMLCMDTTDLPISVFFPAGILTDPNNDLNPATTVSIKTGQ